MPCGNKNPQVVCGSIFSFLFPNQVPGSFSYRQPVVIHPDIIDLSSLIVMIHTMRHKLNGFAIFVFGICEPPIQGILTRPLSWSLFFIYLDGQHHLVGEFK